MIDLGALKKHMSEFKGNKTTSIVTDRYLNQYEEVFEDGEYKKKLIGNKKKDGKLSDSEKDYYLDTKICKVIDGLHISSGEAVKSLENLKQSGITHIVNVATSIPCMFPNEIKYIQKDIADVPDAPILQIIEEVLPFIDEGIQTKGQVLVHCNQGISRSASIVIAYLMKYQSVTFTEAILKTSEARPVIRPNYGFENQLKQFEIQLRGGQQEQKTE